ncbi:reverse transcriptase domain-containing protein [Tanacetum coccineum]
MTPTKGMEAIKELSAHSFSCYNEGDIKTENKEFQTVLNQIHDFENNMNIMVEVKMAQHEYETPMEGRISNLEETLNNFIKESRIKQKESENLVWDRETGSLPISTETNPRGLANAITTRSGLNYNPPKNLLENVTTSQEGLTTKETTIKNGDNDPDKPRKSMESFYDSIPFPGRLKKEKEKEQFRKFSENLQQLSINIPFFDTLEKMPKYAKFMKDLLTRKGKTKEISKIILNERCSAVLLNKIPFKETDPGSFTIISLMLDLGELKPTRMCIELANKSTQYPRGIAENVIIKINKFIFPVDFVVLDMKEDHNIPIILGRPFLATTHAMINVFNKKISFEVGNETITFDTEKSMKFSTPKDDECLSVDLINNVVSDLVKEILPSSTLNSFLFERILNFQQNSTNLWEEEDNNSEDLDKEGLPSDHDNWEPIRPTLFSTNTIEAKKQPPKLKELPSHLEYAFLNNNQEFLAALAWKVADIKGISPSFCTHKNLMEDNFKPVVQPQRRLNPKVQDVVKAEIIKLLDNGLIYAISDKRLSGNEYYCFLDGFSGYFQIPLAPEDQEKTTFTCPYGTFAYRRVPFGLCNAPATFQRCMTAIFHDMCKDFMEVFMNDFSVFGNSFDSCLTNLSKMLARCEETNLVLNWEKCHFMVKEGIVLGHKISKSGIEVNHAKVEVIAKLPYLTNVKGVRSFLGHAGFYQRFIKDFSKIARPMTQLLIKDAKFIFSNECMQAFDILKNKLTSASVIIAPDWNLDFELMCDASDYAIGAVLGQRIDKKFRPIYYASKTMNDAQEHYTTTEKELLAVVQKGTENLDTDHLSRLEKPDLKTLNEEAIRDSFPDEYLMAVPIRETAKDPWYADYANFLVSKIIPHGLTYHLRKKFLSDVKYYIWDDPYLKSCPDRIIQRCVFGKEMLEILKHYHTGPTGGHYGADITARKIFESRFYWPTIFRDASRYIRDCNACQRTGNISSRNQMPLTNIIVSEIFNIWGIDFMGPFPSSLNNKYILVAIDYVSKWVEAEALPTNDARVVVKFLWKLFSRFGVPKALISDRETHFYNSLLEKTLKKYGVTHRLATPIIRKQVVKLKTLTVLLKAF